ncbi:lantibiotic dehydratase [Kitasatospora sp. NPDC127059]|uniref:lantibiotic dehydratase n=1 Tax=unclassified Kitasatospora TaxID=2633591 RepID=UPI00364C3E76
MPDTPTFACGEVALLRAAVRPARSLPEHPSPQDSDPAAQDTAPAPQDTDLDQLRAALRDGLLREAVAVSSPSLSRVLDLVEAGLPIRPKQQRKAARALTRYRLRMSDRATPFGLMAGVATARFADRPAVRWGGRPRKSARPDQQWLTGLVAALEHELPVLRGLRVTANDLCRVRDDRLVLPYLPVPGAEQRTAGRELSIRRTAAIRTVLAHAAEPLPWTELHRAVLAAHPQVEAAAVDWLLGELVRTQILLTDLLPPAAEPDPVGHLLARLPDLPVKAELLAVQADLAAYQGTAPGAGLPRWRALTERMHRLHPAERLVQVDLGLDVEVRLPPAVRREVERAADALWAVSAGRPGPAHLRQYHEDFLERYGLGRAVPLLELLDPERGLGAPAGYRLPRSTRALRPDEPADPRDQLLLALAQRAAADGERELVLDAALLARLSASTGTAPPSLDLLAELRAASQEALVAGEFTLVVSGIGATAGAMAGRFAPVLGEAGRPLTETVRTLPTDNPEAVRAQLAFRTPRAHTGNVARVPQLLPYAITLAQFADRTDPAVLGIDDLAVVADHDRLAVVSRRLGREVVPTLPHMLATDVHAPNAARLLDELSRSGAGSWPRWRWGAADALPFLPRVRYGRTVLSPARWLPEEPALRDAAVPYRQWCARLAEWRRRWRVPRVVRSVSEDQRITLDLADDRHRELLHHAWTTSADGHLQEVPPEPTGWLGEDGRSNELAFPLIRRSPGTARTPAVAPPRRRTVHGPGSSPWLYAKLYCSTARQDELLDRQLPQLLAELPAAVDRWFYIRYLDPRPHLRLRFHGDPTALCAELLPALGAWADRLATAGLAERLVLDGYEPELERYGGPAAMAAAERVFAADSRSCLVQLRLLRERRLDIAPLTLVAANYVDLAHHFGDLGLLTRLHRATERHQLLPAVREQARALIDPSGHWTALGRLPGGSELLASWDERAAAVAAYRTRLAERWSSTDTALGALLHMHHNRLIGVDRTGEERSLALARRTVRAYHGRLAALGEAGPARGPAEAVLGAAETIE